MRILVLNYEFPPVGGGGGRASEDLCRVLAGRGHDIRVQTSHVKGLPKIEDRNGYRIYRSFSFRRRVDRCTVWEMAAFLVTNLLPGLRHALVWRPDVIHVHFAVPTGVLALLIHLASRIPYILTAHCGDVPGALPAQTGFLFRVIGPLTHPIWKRAGAVVAVSGHIKTLALKSYNVTLEVIPNGIDLLDGTSPLLTASQPKRLIFAGRFDPQKNLLFLVDVLKGVSDLEWRFDMVGDGKMMQSIRNRIQDLALSDRVRLHGWVDPQVVEEIMGQNDILILPSVAEGLPLVGTMALRHGLAILGSDVGGISDLVKNGENGFLCPVNDSAAFIVALRTMLGSDELLKKMKHESRQLACSFDIENTSARYEEIFDKVLSSDPGCLLELKERSNDWHETGKRWERVCVMLPAGLGDIVKSSFWLREVKKRAKVIDLIAAGSDQAPELARDLLQLADRIINLSFSGFTLLGYLSYPFGFLTRDLRRILEQHYDLLLIPLANPLALFISLFVRAKKKYVGFSSGDDVRLEYGILKRLGIQVSDCGPWFKPLTCTSKRLQAVLSKTQKNIIINPSCSLSPQSPRDWWGFSELSNRLKKRYNLIFVGKGLTEFSLKGTHDLMENTTVAELSSLINAADAVISIDSFPFHLAYALGVPVVGIFGPINPLRRIPPIKDKRFIKAIHHTPATAREGNRHMIRRKVHTLENIYTRDISVDEVISSVECLLKKFPRSLP
jgi:glycosyltransferase involved in cell wall biosynthesis/ADP-heptose:LPS heptosyltransferase